MEENVEWRRHPFTLIRNIWPILLQPLLSLAAVIVVPLRFPGLSVSTVATGAVLLCCVGTFLVASARLVTVRAAAPTPALTRRALLVRMTRPWQYIIIGSAFLFAGFVFVYVLFIGPLFIAPLVGPVYPWIAVILYYVVILGWLVLEYMDWRNEHYILTPESIIDVARVPIFYSQRTEVPLAQVQNVTASRTFLGGLFGYGRVVVETAGRTQAVVFEDVPSPYRIQQLIFQYIDHWREQEMEQRREEWAAQTLRWFEGYHDITTRVECHHYPTEIQVDHPAHIQWRVYLPEGVAYKTYLHWDTTSHAWDDGYSKRTPDQPGIGSGWYREMLPMDIPCQIYFKARVAVLRNGDELYSTTEQFYTVVT